MPYAAAARYAAAILRLINVFMPLLMPSRRHAAAYMPLLALMLFAICARHAYLRLPRRRRYAAAAAYDRLLAAAIAAMARMLCALRCYFSRYARRR